MKNFKIKSYCKINLSLSVLNKLRNGYHSIRSLITFCNIYDEIFISEIKGSKDKINFSGRFKKGISKKINTITKLLKVLRENKLIKNKIFKINIKKNIPHGSGLGGGSSNAANLLNYLNYKMKLKLDSKSLNNLASKIGSDVEICVKNKNPFITGKIKKILRSDKKFNLYLIITYPNIVCSTSRMYKKNKKFSFVKKSINFPTKKKLFNFLENEENDLQSIVTKTYPKVKELIKYISSQNGCYFSRISGSGSACIGIFSNMKNAIYAQKLIKLKYPKYWSIVSKTI